MRKVAATDMGAIRALNNNVADFWKSFAGGVSTVSAIIKFGTNIRILYLMPPKKQATQNMNNTFDFGAHIATPFLRKFNPQIYTVNIAGMM